MYIIYHIYTLPDIYILHLLIICGYVSHRKVVICNLILYMPANCMVGMGNSHPAKAICTNRKNCWGSDMSLVGVMNCRDNSD